MQKWIQMGEFAKFRALRQVNCVFQQCVIIILYNAYEKIVEGVLEVWTEGTQYFALFMSCMKIGLRCHDLNLKFTEYFAWVWNLIFKIRESYWFCCRAWYWWDCFENEMNNNPNKITYDLELWLFTYFYWFALDQEGWRREWRMFTNHHLLCECLMAGRASETGIVCR